ncbi:hypothetical protein [Streptomyces sp. NPDC058291]|uniref:hypothetical protein n=1 Tax=Streptomyces sp. NPDC058291 TaxID=3346427 RepID=UPI0036E385AF
MLFSAPEGALSHPAAASPPPATNPFQAPDFGDDETFANSFAAEDADAPGPDVSTARRRAS